ncbi:MAG TPA: histidine kinase, partial [Ktedonobacteraceae bacterium]|nr:histidine kinase [Ktedonobacteraceae bacterium]
MSNSAKPSTGLLTVNRSPYLLWLIWVIWLPFAVPAFIDIFLAHSTLPHLIVSLAGAALFFGIYLWFTLRNAQRLIATTAPTERTPALAWLPIIALTMLCSLLVLSNGLAWGTLFVFTAAYAAGRLPLVQAALALIALELIVILGTLLSHLGWSESISGIKLIAAVGVVVISLARSVATERELRVAREEIAGLAVMTERLRIARDLHDLLGHNLSLIALKSELARRLLSASPERAALEISDVENVARTTLEEVREAVTNYRQPTLANELHAASEILAAAGIAYHYQNGESSTVDALPTQLEAVLSWAVREGVTNVIRHSHAHQCVIHMTRDKQRAGIEIIDDGQGSATPAALAGSLGNAGNGGNGLR